ncbi:hypothetical protein P4S81_06680 [Pseudoalteromonas sp. B28]
MSIRGFSATNDIFVDGIRDVAGYTRDIYNIEAVEVAKGYRLCSFWSWRNRW